MEGGGKEREKGGWRDTDRKTETVTKVEKKEREERMVKRAREIK